MSRKPDCEHEDAPDVGPCPGCGMVMVYCHACSDAGGAERAIYHGEPACPTRETKALDPAGEIEHNT